MHIKKSSKQTQNFCIKQKRLSNNFRVTQIVMKRSTDLRNGWNINKSVKFVLPQVLAHY